MSDGLSKLNFSDGGSGDFIRFKADEPVKMRVFTTNPLVHETTFTDKKTGEVTASTKYAFAVWNYGEQRAMILDASGSIAKGIHQIHTDEDYGEDVTKLDIKIMPTGEMLERRYGLGVLPKPQILDNAATEALKAMDEKLDVIFKDGVRATNLNEDGSIPSKSELDTVAPVIEGEEISLDDIPY